MNEKKNPKEVKKLKLGDAPVAPAAAKEVKGGPTAVEFKNQLHFNNLYIGNAGGAFIP